MSKLMVEVVNIDKIEKHPNADRLELATVKGWNCVVQKDKYKEGDKALYIPIDSILPEELETKIFGPNSKVKLHKHRVKTIKLRGAISQGLIVDLETVGLSNKNDIGSDHATILGIKKYEPPAAAQANLSGGAKSTKKQINPNFRKYTSIENFKNYNKAFDGEIVSVTEKIHGTNFRAGWVPFQANTIWQKFLSFIGLAPKWEFVFGSHNVQLQGLLNDNKFFYDKNVYAEAVKKYDLKNILSLGEVVYGEIYGHGIQKNYSYGCGEGEHELVLFDIMVNGEYLDVDKFFTRAFSMGLPTVKELYRGIFDLEKIRSILKGNSKMFPDQKVIEGGVIKPLKEQNSYMGRKVLKLINDEYLLLKNNSEFH